MSESFPTEQPDFSDQWNPQVHDQLAARVAKVDVLLRERGIEPGHVVFAGYDPNVSKQTGPQDEHHHSDGTYDYYFGSLKSLVPPELGSDLEEAEDALYGNPLKFAQEEGHVLGVFDAAQLAPYVTEIDEEVGNYIVTAHPDVIAAASLAEFDLNQ